MDVNQLFELLDQIPKNDENEQLIEETRRAIEEGDYSGAIDNINKLYRGESENDEQSEEETEEETLDEGNQDMGQFDYISEEDYDQQLDYEDEEENEEDDEADEIEDEEEIEEEEKSNKGDEKEKLEVEDEEEYNDEELMVDEGQEEEEEDDYPPELKNPNLEETYIGMLLNNPKAMSMYYVVFTDCYFESNELLNVYKSVLFMEGQAYAPELAKRRFNFATETTTLNETKEILKEKYADKNYNFEKIYVEIRKLFLLRKHYRGMPIKTTQKKIAEIVNYYLYDKMSIEETEAAVEQVTVTQKFKSAILSKGASNFLMQSDNNLTTGLQIPFRILSSVFKGIRKGETTSFSMPSNSGKSRFTIALAAYIAFVHKKKVLVISNEMSEEKMKLCLITTILNNPEIQKLHGQKMIKSEGELLEFKFRPDDPTKVKVDEKGFAVREPNETQTKFSKRLEEESEEYRKVLRATDWLDQQLENSIYFINITDHTNDELKKVIVNYYYKEKIEYMFYDTMKTDTENIGNGEELKKTATILSNLAQDFNIYIGSTLQLTETATLPINLSISDLAVSRTVKEVLDTLCLIKQIPNENYKDYEYSEQEVGGNWKDLEVFKDPNVRYYACVVDKNRAGAKPKVLFRLNLAYNIWEELGYLRLKSNEGAA